MSPFCELDGHSSLNLKAYLRKAKLNQVSHIGEKGHQPCRVIYPVDMLLSQTSYKLTYAKFIFKFIHFSPD